jgi:lipopolysaccharide transport system permease protein
VATSTATSYVTTIRAGERPGWRASLAEVVARRDLLWLMVARDVKARYAQTALGLSWAVIQPLATMLVFSVFFGRLANVPSSGLPYPIFSLAALVPWTYFASAVMLGTNSLLSNMSLLTKVYMPRLLLPLAATLSSLVNLVVSLVLLLFVMAGYGYYPPLEAIVLLPPLVALAVLAALAVSVWSAPAAVRYRDVRQVAPFLVQLWLFVTPVIYPVSLVPESYRWLYYLNPLTGVVDGFRAALLPGETVDPLALALSFAVSAVVLLAGIRYFRGAERSFADVV